MIFGGFLILAQQVRKIDLKDPCETEQNLNVGILVLSGFYFRNQRLPDSCQMPQFLLRESLCLSVPP